MLSIDFVDIKRREFDESIDSKRREIGSLLMSARKPYPSEAFGFDRNCMAGKQHIADRTGLMESFT
jgi:hypothetical protein